MKRKNMDWIITKLLESIDWRQLMTWKRSTGIYRESSILIEINLPLPLRILVELNMLLMSLSIQKLGTCMIVLVSTLTLYVYEYCTRFSATFADVLFSLPLCFDCRWCGCESSCTICHRLQIHDYTNARLLLLYFHTRIFYDFFRTKWRSIKCQLLRHVR